MERRHRRINRSKEIRQGPIPRPVEIDRIEVGGVIGHFGEDPDAPTEQAICIELSGLVEGAPDQRVGCTFVLPVDLAHVLSSDLHEAVEHITRSRN